MATLRLDWYVLQSKPNSQKDAMRHLAQQGFEVFQPEIIERNRAGKLITKPMFGSYLFVAFDIRDFVWRYIPSTIGVHRLLSANAETPLPLPHSFIPNLRQMLHEAGGKLDLNKQQSQLGTHMRVVAGPLAGKEGICSKVTSQRVGVLLEILGGTRNVELPLNEVKVVG